VGNVLEGYHGDGDVNYVIVRSLDEALEPARALIGRLYYIAMGSLAFGILLTLGLARKLSGPIDKLVAFTRLISAGQLESRTDIKGPTEIADLGRSMNKMAGDLCDSRKKLEESKKKVEEINEHLEELVEERTRDLKVANAEISEMLDNLDAAVFIVDEQLRVVGRHSPACSEIFGIEDLEGKGLDEFLFMGDEHSDEDLSRHMFALRMSFGAPTFQFEMSQVNLMAKKEYEHPEKDEDEKQRTFEIRYAPLADEFDFVQRLLIVVSDLTEMLALEASIAAQAESADAKVNAIMEMASSQRDMCGDFVDEQVDRIVQIKNDMASWYSTREEESRSRFLRDLHTIKGNARALRLKGVSSLVHEIEGIVGEHIDADDGSDEFVEVVEQIQLLEARLTIYRETYDDFFRVGGDQGESSGAGALALGRVDARLEAISGLLDASSRSALDAMRSLTRDESSGKVSGMASTFAMHDPMVSEVSETLGKEVMPLSESSPEWELYVSPDLARAFRDATTHSVRNNLDHGLEDPDSREANGKDRQGRIWLDLTEQDEHFLVTIRDDGRGINTEKVLEAAKKRGALAANAPEPANDEEIIELLFQDDMSTKEEVTDVSGRGVGMGAVRQMLAEQRVETRLYNHPDGGAALELTISKEQVCYVDRSGSVQLIGGTDTSVQQVA
jgi:chemotaxis protein histidine kinase CheA